MSRKEYMEQLDMLLRDIPHMERREALQYYEDYFEDAGEEHEADVIEELGSPEELAKKLREDLKKEEGSQTQPQGQSQAQDSFHAQAHAKNQGPGVQNAAAGPAKKPGNGYKTMTVCFIVLGILIGIGQLCRLVRGVVWIVEDVSGGEPMETVTESFPVYGENEIQDFKIQAGVGELIIERWNGEEISISYPKTYMKVKKEGNELSLEMKKRWYGWFGNWRNWVGLLEEDEKSYQILVKIPKDYMFHEAEIETGAGTATIEWLAAFSISLETGAGEVEAGELIAAEEISIEAGVGETVVHNLRATAADFSIGVGELNIKGRVDGDISAECGVGELTMELSNAESDFNYDVTCGVGDVSVNGRNYSGLGSSHREEHDAAYDFDISCGVGSIEVFLTGSGREHPAGSYMEDSTEIHR